MKKLLTVLFTVLLVFTLVGCSSAAPATDDAAAPADSGEAKSLEEMTFAYIVSSTNDYWTRLNNAAQAKADSLGLNMQVTVTPQGDVAAAVAAFDAAVAQGVDGIVVAMSDPDAFLEPVNKAVAAGITVIAVDQDSPKSDRQAFAGTSNYDSGVACGKFFLDKVGDTEQKVAIYAGTITASNAVERMAGFKDTVKGHDNIEIVTYEQVNNDVQITMDKTYALFNAYPDITAIYGVFAYDPLGAAKACKELGKDNVFVFGFDDLEESVELMKEGWIQGLAVQQPEKIGEVAIEAVVAGAQGLELPNTATSVDIITAK